MADGGEPVGGQAGAERASEVRSGIISPVTHDEQVHVPPLGAGAADGLHQHSALLHRVKTPAEAPDRRLLPHPGSVATLCPRSGPGLALLDNYAGGASEGRAFRNTDWRQR